VPLAMSYPFISCDGGRPRRQRGVTNSFPQRPVRGHEGGSDKRALVYPHRPYLANLSVTRSWRRRGVGLQLARACEEIVSRKWGYDEIILEVEATNAAALDLYKVGESLS
jgi:ribosomal protein S18 acetylase RimI-like enzyme